MDKKYNSHAPEITTHINDYEHSKGPVFEPANVRKDAAHPKVEKGCYANSMKPSRQEKM